MVKGQIREPLAGQLEVGQAAARLPRLRAGNGRAAPQ